MANLISRNDVQAAIAAPVIAKMGYKPEPTLDTTILYGIGQLSADGREKSRHLFPQLVEAHQTAIQLLAEQGITTPDAFRALCLLPGNTLTKTELSVNNWVEARTWETDTNDEGELIRPIAEGEICVFAPQSGYMRQADLEMINDKTARVKVASAWVYSAATTSSDYRITQLPQGTVVKGLVASGSYYSVKFRTTTDPIHVIYELATPLTIPFSEPLNLTFTDFDPEDGIVLYDRDSNPLWQSHRINVWVNPSENAQTATLYAKSSDYPVEADRLSCIQYVDTLPEGVTKAYHLDYGSPNPEWVEQHKTLPSGIRAQLQGLGLSFNADYLSRLEARVAALEAK